MTDADARASLHNNDEHLIVMRTAALHLRSEIQAMPTSLTLAPASIETLKSCLSDLPEEMLLFYKTLLCGLQTPYGVDNREAVNTKVISMS